MWLAWCPLQPLCCITSSCATKEAVLCTPGSLPWICVESALSTPLEPCPSSTALWPADRGFAQLP